VFVRVDAKDIDHTGGGKGGGIGRPISGTSGTPLRGRGWVFG